MPNDKITQQEMVFYKLWSERRQNKDRYVPTWEFLGEMFIKELNKWVLMSYKCPARLTEILQENPNMLERKLVVGRSGAKYYGYRFNPNVKKEDIKDENLSKFYSIIKARKDAEIRKQKA